MSCITIKTYDLSAEFVKVHTDAKNIIIQDSDIEFIKSYWYYILFDNIVELTKLRGNHTVTMVYLDGLPSGLSISSIGDNVINVELLVVSKNCRGRGFGTLLLNDLIAKNKTKKLSLDVHADNFGAIKLYKRYGFRFADLYGDYINMIRPAIVGLRPMVVLHSKVV